MLLLVCDPAALFWLQLLGDQVWRTTLYKLCPVKQLQCLHYFDVSVITDLLCCALHNCLQSICCNLHQHIRRALELEPVLTGNEDKQPCNIAADGSLLSCRRL